MHDDHQALGTEDLSAETKEVLVDSAPPAPSDVFEDETVERDDPPVEIKKRDHLEQNRRFILTVVLIVYAAGFLLPVGTWAFTGRSIDETVLSLFSAVVATAGPVIGFYFAKSDSK